MLNLGKDDEILKGEKLSKNLVTRNIKFFAKENEEWIRIKA